MYRAICGPKKFEDGKPPAQGEVDGLLKELGYSVDVNETLNAGIFQAPMGNEPALQAMFEEVKAGM